MSNLTSRNVLICVVPTVIVILTAYWFRRKKKFKSHTAASGDTKLKEISQPPLGLFCASSSESGDTLSDASSLTSPEGSEKSLRTKISIMSLSKDSLSSDFNTNSNHVGVESPTNLLQTGNHVFGPKTLNANSSDVNHVIDNVNHAIDNVNQSNEVIFKSKALEVNCYSKSHSKENFRANMNDLSLSSVKENGVAEENGNEKEIIENNESKHILIYNHIASPNTISPAELHNILNHEIEFERSRMTETDSNDSHSSVLDENSLSYISDDSDGKNPTEVKSSPSNEVKSPSSVLDENSFLSSTCYDSDKSQSDSPFTKSLVDTIEPCEEIKFSSLSLNDSSSSQSHGNCLDVLETDVQKELSQSNVEERCSSLIISSDEAQHVLGSSNPECDSKTVPQNSTQTLKEDTVSNHIQDFIPSPELIALVSQGNSVQLCESKVPCDSPASDSTTPKSSTDSVSEVSENPEVSEGDTKEKKVETDSSANSVPSSMSNGEEPQIRQMNISLHLNSNSAFSSRDSISDSRSFEVDKPVAVMDGSCKPDDEADLKVPANVLGEYTYEFELPQELCGRLIGRGGNHVKSIKERTNANVFIKRHPYDPNLKLVVVEGNPSNVKNALDIIRRKFPLSQFPLVSLAQTNMLSPTGVALPESLQWSRLYFSYLLPSTCSYVFDSCVVNCSELCSICVTQLHLPEGASCDVILSSLVSAGHFFLQQPTHPTYPSLSTLDQCMIGCYSQDDTPLLPSPIEAGVICVAPVMRGWFRAQVVYVVDNGNECVLRYVDYGGFSKVPTSSLRQIRSDFMSLPFQASECYLANVRPISRTEGWSAEATATFEELAQGQILQALLVEYAEDGIPCVHLYRVQGVSSMFINKELVERGLALWVNNSHWDPH